VTNPKGTQTETAAAKWLQLHGFPGAQRKPKYGNRDRGDLDLAPSVIAEVKAYKLPTGTPTPAQLDKWMAQAAAEKANAGAAYCPLIVKRPGTTDVGRWFAFLTFADLALLTGAFVPLDLDDVPVSMPVSALALLLRSAGYGEPLRSALDLDQRSTTP
jgi:hypothetical protein